MGGILSRLFGSKASNARVVGPASSIEPLRLAAGRGFTQQVVGESYRQDSILAFVGQKKPEGFNLEVTIQLVVDDGNSTDPEAVGVLLDRRHVGYIPREDAAAFRSQIMAINPDERPVTCKGKIVGGWDRGSGDTGHFGIKLSVAKPLRVEK